MHGHALGASGALELVAVLGALHDGVVPPTLNLDTPTRSAIWITCQPARAMRVRAALSNSFAFGGLNAVLAIRPPGRRATGRP
jgi:nodulation protein E